jgi:putative Mn2+ efflux pump MntP
MNFDLRLPIGIMFSLFGAILVVYGIVQREASTRLHININLYWGAVLLVFGVLMLVFALRSRSRNGDKP